MEGLGKLLKECNVCRVLVEMFEAIDGKKIKIGNYDCGLTAYGIQLRRADFEGLVVETCCLDEDRFAMIVGSDRHQVFEAIPWHEIEFMKGLAEL